IIVDPFANLHYSICPIKETKEGIWCVQEHKGIIIYNGKSATPNLFSSTEIANLDSLLTSNSILYRNIIVSNDNYIFMISSTRKILQISFRTHKFSYLMNAGNNLCAIAC